MVASVKIFKKSSPNGVLFAYLGERDFASDDGYLNAIAGVANVPEEHRIQGKIVYASLVCTFRHGREEDETCGLKFAKEMVLDRAQVWPNNNSKGEPNKLQLKLMQKLGDNARHFILQFPQNSPNSVAIVGEPGDRLQMGVSYEVRLHIADRPDDFKGNKKSTVAMSVNKTQMLPTKAKLRSPTATAEKGFLTSKGKVQIEVSLDKEINLHGDEIPISIVCNNSSSKTVTCIRVGVVQRVELTMIQTTYTTRVTTLETKDGCPLGPGGNLQKEVVLKPVLQGVAVKRGVAMDGNLGLGGDSQGQSLASSTWADTGNLQDLTGAIVSYSINVKLVLSGMGGELDIDLPFKLFHARPSIQTA